MLDPNNPNVSIRITIYLYLWEVRLAIIISFGVFHINNATATYNWPKKTEIDEWRNQYIQINTGNVPKIKQGGVRVLYS